LIHLKDVEQRLILDAEAARLQKAATAATTERNDRTTAQLQTALEENRQLKLELDDVRKRLDTITSIERSIRERENGPNTQ
jgi:regulator of replication initiation timing